MKALLQDGLQAQMPAPPEKRLLINWTWRPETIVTAAEGLRPGMRELIEAQLGGKVSLSYGSREFMLIGMECSEHAGYHISSDNLYVEVVDDEGKPLPPGEVGRIVITDLHNEATPFIRYEIGDLGSMGVGSGEWTVGGGELGVGSGKGRVEGGELGVERSQPACSCGLPFARLLSVEGRLQEVIVRPDGERLTALFVPHLMKEFGWVDGYQVEQEEPGVMTMALVTDEEGWREKTGEIEGPLREKLGEGMEIEFRRVGALTKLSNGKTPIVIGASSS
ncbi:MAG: phenylacetate--CoA ligase family protein [Phycisphaeraceae bacterium]|nr:phenylacetate--CoA ligase family protein [Phycisphaeraceae bacterium]